MPAVNPAMASTADDDKPSFPVMNLYVRKVSLGISLVECRSCVWSWLVSLSSFGPNGGLPLASRTFYIAGFSRGLWSPLGLCFLIMIYAYLGNLNGHTAQNTFLQV